MKILFVITQGEWGGAQKYVFDLATGNARDHEVIVAIGESRRETELEKELKRWTLEHGTLNRGQGVSNMEHGAGSIGIVKLNNLKRNISPFQDILAIFFRKNILRYYAESNEETVPSLSVQTA